MNAADRDETIRCAAVQCKHTPGHQTPVGTRFSCPTRDKRHGVISDTWLPTFTVRSWFPFSKIIYLMYDLKRQKQRLTVVVTTCPSRKRRHEERCVLYSSVTPVCRQVGRHHWESHRRLLHSHWFSPCCPPSVSHLSLSLPPATTVSVCLPCHPIRPAIRPASGAPANEGKPCLWVYGYSNKGRGRYLGSPVQAHVKIYCGICLQGSRGFKLGALVSSTVGNHSIQHIQLSQTATIDTYGNREYYYRCSESFL